MTRMEKIFVTLVRFTGRVDDRDEKERSIKFCVSLPCGELRYPNAYFKTF